MTLIVVSCLCKLCDLLNICRLKTTKKKKENALLLLYDKPSHIELYNKKSYSNTVGKNKDGFI